MRHLTVNSRLLVWRQKSMASLVAAATQAHGSRRDILEPGAEDNDGPSRRPCTASSEEQSASAGHHVLAASDHARTTESQRSDVQQHSEQTVTLFATEAKTELQ